MTILVLDIGTSSVRAALAGPDGMEAERRTPLPPTSDAPGLVEFDPTEMADTTLAMASAVIADSSSPIDGVGLATQRSSAVAWDRDTGRPIGPGLSWQDHRTFGACIAHHENGISLAPNQAASKFEYLLDTYDPHRARNICLGTVDSWVLWQLSGGALHVTDQSNACVTGLWSPDTHTWAPAVVDALRLPADALPTVVDSIGVIGQASALPGAPPIAAVLGDQQASLLGQGCTTPGATKATFGTGAMLNVCGSTTKPASFDRSPNGTFPLVAWSRDGQLTWATEAIMLAAGSAVQWLCDTLGVVDSVEQVSELASTCDDTAGVTFVPDLVGAGTPQWDFAATGAFLGLTRGTTKAHIARAVLEGVAQRGADLLDASIADGNSPPVALRIDGGMAQSLVFVQALANTIERPVEISGQVEATALGAATGASLGLGLEVAPSTEPQRVVEPSGPSLDRSRWRAAVRSHYG